MASKYTAEQRERQYGKAEATGVEARAASPHERNTMKIDLDELECRIEKPLSWINPVPVGASAAEARAMIARIHELESYLGLQCDRIDAFHETYTKITRDPLDIRAIIRKGVVIDD